MCPIEWPGVPTAVTPGTTSSSQAWVLTRSASGSKTQSVVREQRLHPAGRRAGALVVVHPEAPLVRGHGDLGPRERRAAVRRDEAADVIAVEVGDDHDVDVVRADADRREVAD